MTSFTLLLLAFFSCAFFTYSTHALFYYLKKTDPINHRSSHNTSATLSGGTGIILTIVSISCYFYFQNKELFDYSLLIPLGIMFITGVYDDFYNTDFKIKFFLQIIVAKIMIDQGYVINHFHGVFGWEEIPWFAAQLFTIFVFLVIVNAINFIDGIDGLAIAIILYVIVVYLFFCQSSPLIPLCIIVIGALLPLFYFNFKKNKKVFLGDGGSLLLGTLCCLLIFHFLDIDTLLTPSFQINKAYLAILILAYPLMDVFRIFFIRIGCKKSPFLPDSNHLHHLLLKKVKSHCITTGVIFLFSIVFLVLHLLIAAHLNDIYLVILDLLFLFLFATLTFKNGDQKQPK